MNVCFLCADSNGGYPVPAVKGGAVSTLIEHLVSENNKMQLFNMTIVSLYDKDAETKSKEYPNVNFIWLQVPAIVKLFDTILFFIILHVFKKRKSISYRSIFSLLYYILRSSVLLRKSRYDKVIIENNIPLAWIIRLSGYKGMYYYHLHNTPRTNARCKKVFQNCNAFLCVSNYVGDEICSKTNPIGPIPKEKIRVLYNCIDTDVFKNKNIDKQNMRRQFDIGDGEKVILFVGRLSEEKGIDQLLYALEFVNTKVKVLIAGSLLYGKDLKDLYWEKLNRLAEIHKDKVLFTGYVDHKDLPTYYNFADISVLPSMWDEPAGLTMIESLACGTPIITTYSGGIPEYVKEVAVILERNEHLPQEIAKSIDMLLNDERSYHKFQHIGMEIVRNNFSTEQYLQNFVSAVQ